MSAQIRHERNDYYDILERTQKGTLDVTPWTPCAVDVTVLLVLAVRAPSDSL